jgi:hypothetical protein
MRAHQKLPKSLHEPSDALRRTNNSSKARISMKTWPFYQFYAPIVSDDPSDTVAKREFIL